MEPEDIINEDLIHIIIAIPKDTARLIINATMLGEDMNPVTAETEMSVSEIMQARKDFLDYVGDDEYNAKYTLTEKGRELAARLAEGEDIDWNALFDEVD